MRNLLVLLILLISLLFFSSAFAFVRSEVIDETLKTIELAQNLKTAEENQIREQYPNPLDHVDTENIPVNSGKTDEESQKFYFSAGYDANHMHYKEIRGGNTLDEDYGKLKGFDILGGYRSNRYTEWMLGKFFVEGYFRRFDEEILYDGASSAGPIEFKERWEAQRFGLKLGAYRDILDKGEFFGYFDLGHNVWYRGENEVINGVLTYAEKYWWTYFGLGTGLNYKFLPKLSVGIEGEFMFVPTDSWSKMRADLYEGGTFKLENVWGAELKIPVKYRIFKNLSLDVTPYFTYWRINESDPVLISGSYYTEPDSNTHIEGVMAGLTYYF